MGLFGGYEKHGPGVSKDEPEKKPFFRFFELYFRKFWKLMIVNLLSVLVSLPLVTQGLGQVGMAYITRQFVREKPAFLPSDFLDAIKKHWKQGLLFGILEIVMKALCAYALYFYFMGVWVSAEFSLGNVIPLAVALFVSAIIQFAWYYVYAQLVTLDMMPKKILKNSFLFAAGCIRQNFVVLLVEVLITVLAAVALINFFWVALGIVLPGCLLVYPAFRAFLIQFVAFPQIKKFILDPYYEEHPDEDVDKRRDLNLDTSSATVDKPEEEPIFVDAPAREIGSSAIPRQYGEEELRRGKKLKRKSNDEDDDGTI